MAKNKLLMFFLYLIAGLYFINYPFKFVEIPEIITIYDKWIIFVGGVLILFGALNHMKMPSQIRE